MQNQLCQKNNSVFGIGIQKDGIEPTFKGRFGLVEDGICQRMKLETAKLASVALAVFNLVKMGGLCAFRTGF